MLLPFNTAVRVGADALRVNPLRTSLSTLGVIIGVAARMAVLSLGDGMERTARARISAIRRAAGATRRDILLQFLSESVAISGFGSVLGVVVGLIGAFGVTAAIRRFSTAAFVPASFSWSSVLAAAAASLLIGLLFGINPARRAAWLHPIDAIRHD